MSSFNHITLSPSQAKMTTTTTRFVMPSKPINLAATLRIPTVQPMIKYTTMRVPSRTEPHHSRPLIVEKTCGLFDFNTTEPNVTTEIDFLDLDMETNMNFNQLINNSNTSEFITTESNSPQSSSSSSSNLPESLNITQAITASPKKTFAQKLTDANLSIKIVKPNSTPASATAVTSDDLMTPQLGFLNLDDSELPQLLTPNTQTSLFNLIGISSADSPSPKTTQQISARIATEEEILACFDLEHFDLQNMNSSPVAAAPQTTTNTLLPPPPPPQPTVNESSLDHAYSMAPVKRRHLSSNLMFEDEDEDDDEAPGSVFSCSGASNFDTFDASTPCTSSGVKRQRTKGVYRARDVTNDEEMSNYLERRKKNNISSKISRANKRNYFSEMEARCDMVQLENKKLAVKIEKLVELNQLMKDYLKEAFVGNLKVK